MLKISGLRAPGGPGRDCRDTLEPRNRSTPGREDGPRQELHRGPAPPARVTPGPTQDLSDTGSQRLRLHITGSGGGGGRALAHFKHPARDVDGGTLSRAQEREHPRRVASGLGPHGEDSVSRALSSHTPAELHQDRVNGWSRVPRQDTATSEAQVPVNGTSLVSRAFRRVTS